jgi:hypothetical protein
MDAPMKSAAVAFAGLLGMLTPPNPTQNNDMMKIVYANPRIGDEYVVRKNALSITESISAGSKDEECRIRLGMHWAGFFCYNAEQKITYVSEGRIVRGKVHWHPKESALDHMADMKIGNTY